MAEDGRSLDHKRGVVKKPGTLEWFSIIDYYRMGSIISEPIIISTKNIPKKYPYNSLYIWWYPYRMGPPSDVNFGL